MDLCFLGAAREVTGSRYLLSTKEKTSSLIAVWSKGTIPMKIRSCR